MRIADNDDCIVVRRKNVGYLLICSISASGKPVMRAIVALSMPSTSMVGCRTIMTGAVDDLPEEAFYMAGTLDDIIAKAQSR